MLVKYGSKRVPWRCVIEFGIIKAKMWQYGAFLVQELCGIWSVSHRAKIVQH